LEASELDPPTARFEGDGDNQVRKGRTGVRYDRETSRIYINQGQYFGQVPQKIWEYSVGGYKVCEQRLKDRAGRTLAAAEVLTYLKILRALDLTVKLQAKLDDLYRVVEE